MSYRCIALERDKDRINVVERVDGERHYKKHIVQYFITMILMVKV